MTDCWTSQNISVVLPYMYLVLKRSHIELLVVFCRACIMMLIPTSFRCSCSIAGVRFLPRTSAYTLASIVCLKCFLSVPKQCPFLHAGQLCWKLHMPMLHHSASAAGPAAAFAYLYLAACECSLHVHALPKQLACTAATCVSLPCISWFFQAL